MTRADLVWAVAFDRQFKETSNQPVALDEAPERHAREMAKLNADYMARQATEVMATGERCLCVGGVGVSVEQELIGLRAMKKALAFWVGGEAPSGVACITVRSDDDGKEYTFGSDQFGMNPLSWQAALRDWQTRNEELVRQIRWMRQTNHQAHHRGPLEDCETGTCARRDGT